MTDKPTVAIVTGASRGAGRGIAVSLGSHGCPAYITGRSENEGNLMNAPGQFCEKSLDVATMIDVGCPQPHPSSLTRT